MLVEEKQPYDKLLSFIDSIGPIDKIANNPEIIKTILALNIDRHILCALIDRINDALSSGIVLPEELTYFRSGKIMDDIVHLDRTVEEYSRGKRNQLFTSEILDKINYISLLHDDMALAACYTHPEIIDALCGKNVKNKSELTWWSTCGTFTTMPAKVQNRIIASVMEQGDIETAKKLINETCHKMPVSQIKRETNITEVRVI